MAVFITVLIVLGALLVLDNTVFGLFTFTIYFYVIRFLIWPWRLLGAAAVGLLAGTSQAYGVNKDTRHRRADLPDHRGRQRGHRAGLHLVPVEHRSARWRS